MKKFLFFNKMDNSVATIGYTFSNPCHQKFPLPYSYNNYVFQNYTTVVYKKLMMTCKQFFAQKRILVIDKVCNNQICYNEEYFSNDFDLRAFKNIKLWITQEINTYHNFLKVLYHFYGNIIRTY